MQFFRYGLSQSSFQAWARISEATRGLSPGSKYKVLEFVEVIHKRLCTVDNVEDFNVLAYEKKCRQNGKSITGKNNDPEIPVPFDIEDDSKSLANSFNGSETYAFYSDQAFTVLDGKMSLPSTISRIVNLRSKIAVETGIDPLVSFLGALQGNVEAESVFQGLIDNRPDIREIFKDLSEAWSDSMTRKGLAKYIQEALAL